MVSRMNVALWMFSSFPSCAQYPDWMLHIAMKKKFKCTGDWIWKGEASCSFLCQTTSYPRTCWVCETFNISRPRGLSIWGTLIPSRHCYPCNYPNRMRWSRDCDNIAIPQLAATFHSGLSFLLARGGGAWKLFESIESFLSLVMCASRYHVPDFKRKAFEISIKWSFAILMSCRRNLNSNRLERDSIGTSNMATGKKR